MIAFSKAANKDETLGLLLCFAQCDVLFVAKFDDRVHDGAEDVVETVGIEDDVVLLDTSTRVFLCTCQRNTCIVHVVDVLQGVRVEVSLGTLLEMLDASVPIFWVLLAVCFESSKTHARPDVILKSHIQETASTDATGAGSAFFEAQGLQRLDFVGDEVDGAYVCGYS